MERQGVDVEFKNKGQTNEIQGVVFSKNGYRFNGSKVDRQFSYSKIEATLRCNNHEERQSMAFSNPAPISNPVSRNSDLIGGSLSLFTPSNQPEEQQPYDPYLRNKKKKKQRKINW